MALRLASLLNPNNSSNNLQLLRSEALPHSALVPLILHNLLSGQQPPQQHLLLSEDRDRDNHLTQLTQPSAFRPLQDLLRTLFSLHLLLLLLPHLGMGSVPLAKLKLSPNNLRMDNLHPLPVHLVHLDRRKLRLHLQLVRVHSQHLENQLGVLLQMVPVLVPLPLEDWVLGRQRLERGVVHLEVWEPSASSLPLQIHLVLVALEAVPLPKAKHKAQRNRRPALVLRLLRTLSAARHLAPVLWVSQPWDRVKHKDSRKRKILTA